MAVLKDAGTGYEELERETHLFESCWVFLGFYFWFFFGWKRVFVVGVQLRSIPVLVRHAPGDTR